jgi:hypothetical protein
MRVIVEMSKSGIAQMAQQSSNNAGIVAVVNMKFSVATSFWINRAANCAHAFLRGVKRVVFGDCHFVIGFQRVSMPLSRCEIGSSHTGILGHSSWMGMAPFQDLRLMFFRIFLSPFVKLSAATDAANVTLAVRFVFSTNKFFKRFFLFAGVAGSHESLPVGMHTMAYHTNIGV